MTTQEVSDIDIKFPSRFEGLKICGQSKVRSFNELQQGYRTQQKNLELSEGQLVNNFEHMMENGNNVYKEHCKLASDMCKIEARKYTALYVFLLVNITFTGAFTGTMASVVSFWAGMGFGFYTAGCTVLSYFLKWNAKAEMYNSLSVRFEDLFFEPISLEKYNLFIRQAEAGVLNSDIK